MRESKKIKNLPVCGDFESEIESGYHSTMFCRVNNSSDELWYSPPSIIRVCGGKNQNESVPFMNIDCFKNIDDERIANTRTI